MDILPTMTTAFNPKTCPSDKLRSHDASAATNGTDVVAKDSAKTAIPVTAIANLWKIPSPKPPN